MPGKVRGAEHAQGGRSSPALHTAMLIVPVFSIAGILFLFSLVIQILLFEYVLLR